MRTIWHFGLMGACVACLVAGRASGLEDAPARDSAPGSQEMKKDDAAARLDEVVARVQAAYRNLETFSADFSQTVTLSGMARTRSDKGHVELKRGGKMRWDFQNPEVKQFISDGRTLWFYFPEEKQVMRMPLEQGANQVALDFMFGLGDVRKDFQVELGNAEVYRTPGVAALHLAPRKSMGTVKRLTILVGTDDGMVKEAIVEDQMGSVTRVVFTNVVINQPIDDARFVFEVPEGVHEAGPGGN